MAKSIIRVTPLILVFTVIFVLIYSKNVYGSNDQPIMQETPVSGESEGGSVQPGQGTNDSEMPDIDPTAFVLTQEAMLIQPTQDPSLDSDTAPPLPQGAPPSKETPTPPQESEGSSVAPEQGGGSEGDPIVDPTAFVLTQEAMIIRPTNTDSESDPPQGGNSEPSNNSGTVPLCTASSMVMVFGVGISLYFSRRKND